MRISDWSQRVLFRSTASTCSGVGCSATAACAVGYGALAPTCHGCAIWTRREREQAIDRLLSDRGSLRRAYAARMGGDRTSGAAGKRVSVRVDVGGRRSIKTKRVTQGRLRNITK